MNPIEATIRKIFSGPRRIALVGASPRPDRDSHHVMQFLQQRPGLRVIWHQGGRLARVARCGLPISAIAFHRRQRLQQRWIAREAPVRIGYVEWCPTDWAERAGGVARLRVDTWVMPSHTQAARVADASLDLAICWVQNSDLGSLGLEARLIGVDRLYAVCVGADTSPVRARDTVVLLDPDEATSSRIAMTHVLPS